MKYFNTLTPRQNCPHFADDIFRCIFMNASMTFADISLKFVPKFRINNILSLVQIMAWRIPGDKPLSKPLMVNLLTHICVTRPQWVKDWNVPGFINIRWNIWYDKMQIFAMGWVVYPSRLGTMSPPGSKYLWFKDGFFTWTLNLLVPDFPKSSLYP